MISIEDFYYHRLLKRYMIILVVALILITVVASVYYALQSSVQPSISDARNWAGYVVASDFQTPNPDFIEVTGSWIVPTLTDIGIDAFSAVWIGIGGKFDTTLIQTGTEQDSIGGLATYYAWYEMLPNNSITISTLNISPGDRIEAAIRLVEARTNLWLIMIADLTTGQSYQSNFTYASSQLSAEWIVERPQINNAPSPLADFGNVTFTRCQATVGAKTGSITDFPSSKIIMNARAMNNQPRQLVDVSNLSVQGEEFTVEYLAP